MECDRCGAMRPRTGRCPNCGAPPPGSSSLSQWKNPSSGRGSGAGWGDATGSRRGSGVNRRRDDYDEVDLEHALVPSTHEMVPLQTGAGLPMVPGLPSTDEEERALGIRRPVYIPATEPKRKRRLGSWRVVSGVLSVMLVCIASCGGLAVLGKDRVEALLPGAIQTKLTPPTFDFTQVPLTPAATPGPAAKYVVSATTARTIDDHYQPIDVTSQFTVGNTVHLVVQMRNVSAGETHVITVHWFVNNVDLGLPLVEGKTQETITFTLLSNAVDFQLHLPAPGVGMAKVYWDRPANATGDSIDTKYLAQKITFAIKPIVPTPGATDTPGTPGSGTPGSATPSAQPTKTGSIGGAPVAWRPGNFSY